MELNLYFDKYATKEVDLTFCKQKIMAISVERTEDAIVIKLPLETNVKDIQRVLNYFEYVDLLSESNATQEQIDDLARDVKKGWWAKNKSRFKDIEEFKNIE